MEKPLRGPLTPVAPVPLTRRAERTMRIATSPPFALYGAFFVETSIKRLRSVSFLMFCLSDGNESASSSRSALSSVPDLVLSRPKTPCRGRRKPEQRRIEKVHAERTDLTPGQRGNCFGASALSKACVIHAKTDVPKRNIRFLSYVLDGYRAAFCPSPAGAVPAAAFAGLCALAGALAGLADASGAPSAGAATVAAAGEAAGAAVGAASEVAAEVEAAADGSAAGAFSGAAGEEVFSAAGDFGLAGAGAFRFKRPDTSGNDGFPAGDFPAAEGAEEGASLLFPASAAFPVEAGSTAGAGLADSGAAVEEVFPAAEDFGAPVFSAPVPALFPASDGAGALMSLSR